MARSTVQNLTCPTPPAPECRQFVDTPSPSLLRRLLHGVWWQQSVRRLRQSAVMSLAAPPSHSLLGRLLQGGGATAETSSTSPFVIHLLRAEGGAAE